MERINKNFLRFIVLKVIIALRIKSLDDKLYLLRLCLLDSYFIVFSNPFSTMYELSALFLEFYNLMTLSTTRFKNKVLKVISNCTMFILSYI